MIVVCPGFHSPQLTSDFLTTMELFNGAIVPPESIPPYNGIMLGQWLLQQVSPQTTTIDLIGFSAGVVGAMGCAIAWQQQGGIIRNLIAIDGWGVPLWGSFPIYRLSHDRFTHETSKLVGTQQRDFYCSPPVSHLALWQSPDTVWGWWEIKFGCHWRCCAVTMIKLILEKS